LAMERIWIQIIKFIIIILLEVSDRFAGREKAITLGEVYDVIGSDVTTASLALT